MRESDDAAFFRFESLSLFRKLYQHHFGYHRRHIHAVGSVSRIHTRANLFSKNAVESLSLAEMQLLYPCVHQQFQPRVEQKHRSLVILKYLARVRTYEVAAKVRIGTLSSFLLWRKGVLFDAGKHTALASARFSTT